MSRSSTEDESIFPTDEASEPVPGVVVVFSGGAPMLRAVALADGAVAVGRDDFGGVGLPDARMSRHHLDVALSGGRWRVEDAGSRNGTFVAGERVRGASPAEAGAVVRAGSSLFLLSADIRPLRAAQVQVDAQRVVGPLLGRALDAVAWAARSGGGVLITGESGTGKELAARDFHRLAAPKGPFVPVNCAAIPGTIAERLLFGTRKGAYSDAKADAVGYVEAADGGVLFLDELGELELPIQAKLLRVLENGEVVPLGAAEPRRVSVRLVAATHRDLRAAVGERAFRADLFYRIGRTEVRLPPLRQRPEEIPWHIERVLERAGKLHPHPALVEACLLRPWPGNVRELVSELEQAARVAAEAGSRTVRPEHLSPTAGAALAPRPEGSGRGGAQEAPSPEAVRDALAAHAGNVSAAARALGLHRTQLYRLMRKLGVKGEEVPE